MQQLAAPARFARRLGPGPVAPAVIDLAPGKALQRRRQLQEGRMPLAQAFPRQPLNFAAEEGFPFIYSAPASGNATSMSRPPCSTSTICTPPGMAR